MSACLETARRVEAWLAKRGADGWTEDGGVARLTLCEQWRAVAREYGSASPAALGCLLALVREAWGITNEGRQARIQRGETPLRMLVSDYGSGCYIEIKAAYARSRFEVDAASLVEALVAALEAAP